MPALVQLAHHHWRLPYTLVFSPLEWPAVDCIGYITAFSSALAVVPREGISQRLVTVMRHKASYLVSESAGITPFKADDLSVDAGQIGVYSLPIRMGQLHIMDVTIHEPTYYLNILKYIFSCKL